MESKPWILCDQEREKNIIMVLDKSGDSNTQILVIKIKQG